MPLEITVGLLNPPTSAALLRGVAGISRVGGDPNLLGLVGEDVTEPPRRPVGESAVEGPPVPPLEALEVLQHDDPDVITSAQDGLDGTVETVIPEAVLTAAERPQSLPAGRCALGLESPTIAPELGRSTVELPRGHELPIGGHGQVPDALIDPDHLAPAPRWWGVPGDEDIEVPVSIWPPHELGGTDLPGPIEEPELVPGEPVVDPHPATERGEGAVVGGDLGCPEVVAHGRQGEVRPCLLTLLPTGPIPSGPEGLGHDPRGRTDVVRLETVPLPDLVIDEIVDLEIGEYPSLPGSIHDLVHGTYEDQGEFGELAVMILPNLDGDRAFHIT